MSNGKSFKTVGQRGMKALGEPVRRSIIDLLGERPATVTELSVTLGKAKGTIAHHVKVLVDAELVEVVATRRIRAVEERTYGRTAPTFVFLSHHLTTLPSLAESWMFDEAAASARLPAEGEAAFTSVRFARIPQDRAEAFKERLTELLDEFVAERRVGDVVYGLLVSLFPTDRPHLGDNDGTEAVS